MSVRALAAFVALLLTVPPTVLPAQYAGAEGPTPEFRSAPACDMPRMARPITLPLSESLVYGEDRTLSAWCTLPNFEGSVPLRTTYRLRLAQRELVELQVSSTAFGAGVSVVDAQGREILQDREGHPDHGRVVQKETRSLRVSLPAGEWFVVVRDDYRVRFREDTRRKLVRVDLRPVTGPAADARILCALPSEEAAPVLPVDGRVRGVLATTDCEDSRNYFARRDVHELVVPTGRVVRVNITGTGTAPTVRVYDLTDSARTPLRSAAGSAPTAAGQRYSLAAGRYFLAVLPEDDGQGNRKLGAYELSVTTEGNPSTDSSSYGAICGRPQPLRLGFESGGQLTRASCRSPDGRVHHDYVLDVPAEQSVRLRVRRTGGVLVPALRLVDASGAEVAVARAEGSDSVEVNLQRRLRAGRYGLRLSANPGTSGVFGLSVQGEARPCRFPADTGASLAVGVTRTGAITPATCILPGNGAPMSAHLLVVTQASELRLTVQAEGFTPAIIVQRVGAGSQERLGPGDTPEARTVIVQPGSYYIGVVSTTQAPGTYRLCAAPPGSSCGGR